MGVKLILKPSGYRFLKVLWSLGNENSQENLPVTFWFTFRIVLDLRKIVKMIEARGAYT